MIYLDTSVVLAQLLSEDRIPSSDVWREQLIASRLIEYELWTRLNARGLGMSHGIAARQLLDRVAMIELTPLVLNRVLDPFPTIVRTLDAMHLASVLFLRSHHQMVELATYDSRLAQAARSLSIPIRPM